MRTSPPTWKRKLDYYWKANEISSDTWRSNSVYVCFSTLAEKPSPIVTKVNLIAGLLGKLFICFLKVFGHLSSIS